MTFNAKGKGTEPNAVVMETNAIPSENADIGADGPQLTEDHYAFDGWYDNEACAGDKFDFTKPLAKDTEVFAKWVESYTISYELDGGTNNENNPASYTAESGTITLKPPRRPGYTFSGWYDNDTFSGSPVTEISQGDTGDRTFYAKWTKNSSGGGSATTKYTLTYNTNGGNSITATKHNKNATVNLTATPTREGYDFTGWYADKELKNAVTSVKMDGDKTVYAGWKAAGAEVDTPAEEIPLLVVTINSMKYLLNGKPMTMDSAPFIDGNNRTMLPVRVIANALGISNENIKWDSATKTASFTRANGKVVSCTVNSNVIKVGDENVTIDTVPVIRNNRIYLPMRALFNAFDVPDENIIWDAAARTVTVTKKD